MASKCPSESGEDFGDRRVKDEKSQEPCPHPLILSPSSFGLSGISSSSWSLGTSLLSGAEGGGWWPPGAFSPSSEGAGWSGSAEAVLTPSCGVPALLPAPTRATATRLPQWDGPCWCHCTGGAGSASPYTPHARLRHEEMEPEFSPTPWFGCPRFTVEVGGSSECILWGCSLCFPLSPPIWSLPTFPLGDFRQKREGKSFFSLEFSCLLPTIHHNQAEG